MTYKGQNALSRDAIMAAVIAIGCATAIVITDRRQCKRGVVVESLPQMTHHGRVSRREADGQESATTDSAPLNWLALSGHWRRALS